MLKELKFVQGAIKKKSHAPELSHYLIRDGRVTGSNGYMTLSAPIPLDFTARPNADLFYKAISACGEVITMNMTPKGRLSVRSGGFKAFIDCLEVDDVYDAKPQGMEIDCPATLLPMLTKLLPFIGEDASRPWAMGLLLHGGMLMATNNVVVVQCWAGGVLAQLPTINIPRYAVAELVRIGQPPKSLQTDGNSLTINFEDGKWLRTQLVDPQWPFEKLNQLFDFKDSPKPLPDGMQAAVDTLRAFVDSDSAPLYFARGGIATSLGEEEGMVVAVPELASGPIFGARQLQTVAETAYSADFSRYPAPCSFYDKEGTLRGLVIGRTS